MMRKNFCGVFSRTHQLSLIILTLVLQALSLNTFADELGDGDFVLKPTSQPSYVSPSGKTRFWPCKGMVSKRLLKLIKSDLVLLSNVYGVPPPSDLCMYSISEVDLMGQNITNYTVDLFINKADMNSCLIQDRCTNIRTMTLKSRNGEVYRQYMVKDSNDKLQRVCLNNQGQLVKPC